MSALFANGGASADSTVKTIRVVMDHNYPPYSFRDSNGRLQGIAIDQWELFGRKTGIKVEISGMEWNEAYQAMLDGKYDVIDTISYNSEREKLYDFTHPYATIDVLIYFHKNISGITDIESLKGFTVAAKKSDNAIKVLEQHGITGIRVYNSAEEIIKAAKNQEIVVFAMGKPPSQYYLYKMGIQNQFRYSETPLYTSQFFRAVKEGNTELLAILNNGFGKITAYEYEAINNKWFGKTNPALYHTELFKVIVLTIIAVGIIALVLLVWNYTLQRKVKQKTAQLLKTIEELKKSEARIRALMEATPDMFFLYDKEGRILDFHTLSEDRLVVGSDQLIHNNLKNILPEEQAGLFLDAIKKALDTGVMQTIEYSLNIRQSEYFFEARLASCSEDTVVAIVRDITERKLSEGRLLEVSIHDALTGLYNRHYFENEILRMESKPFSSIYVAIFDLDGLKIINDTLGHIAGDQYLKTAAELIIKAFPKESMVSRIGGDEICVILLDKSKEELNGYMKQFNSSLEEINRNHEKLPISISFGYVFSNQKSNIMEMIREADNQMYRVKLHRRQSVKSEVVQMMKNMLEARDFVTEGHVTRMEDLAVKLAEAINFPEKDIADIRLLAQFHDIGKVGIPDHILFKPSKLTDEEFNIMKQHTEIGHRIAVTSNDLLPIADFILKHHEYWNGKGYPFGLKGEEIPVECRILSIVDAYDAMTHDRPYRKAMTKAEALQELRKCAGGQFDPGLVEKFIQLMDTDLQAS